jgi:hypothetical protein
MANNDRKWSTAMGDYNSYTNCYNYALFASTYRSTTTSTKVSSAAQKSAAQIISLHTALVGTTCATTISLPTSLFLNSNASSSMDTATSEPRCIMDTYSNTNTQSATENDGITTFIDGSCTFTNCCNACANAVNSYPHSICCIATTG